MNGDISLSHSLGGLRIANPDEASATPVHEQASGHEENRRTEAWAAASSSTREFRGADASSDMATMSQAPPDPRTAHPTPRTDYSRSVPHTFESAAALLKTAQNNLNVARGLPISTNTSDLYLPTPQPFYHSASAPAAGRPPGPRPMSSAYPGSSIGAAEPSGPPYNVVRSERSSMYAMPTRSDSRAAPTKSPLPARESSRSQRGGPMPPNGPNGPLLTRRSSRGVGTGYASISGVPHAPANSALERSLDREPLPMASRSEEWKDKGAAVGVRREVDDQGRTVLKPVKKGVRDFSFGRVLGEGSYSTVFLATDRQTLREYAVKVLEKKHIIKEKKIKYVNIEKNTLNRLTEHPGIVRLYYTFQDEMSLYYVLDLCNGGELLGVLKKTGTFDVECTRFYGAQILDAIEYMHSRGVIHRDLKPENVLLDDQMHVKITDFGTAKLLPDPRSPRPPEAVQTPEAPEEKRAASFVGTAEYVSPELLTDKSAGKACDVWAFGCIIYQLLAGRPPFKGGTEYLTFQKIVNLEYEFPAGFPPAAQDLVERCLVSNPIMRLTVEHIKKHDFFEGQRFGKELWKMKAPRLNPHVPPPQEPHIIQLNEAGSTTPSPQTASRALPAQSNTNGTRPPARIITELPPPTQLDIEWSPVLTRNNERILKLGDLMVISSPMPNSPHGKGEHGDGHKKLSRFFGGSTTKKRQRLVMVTSSGRIVMAPAGGEDKRAKQEISLLAPDAAWRCQVDAKGQMVWCCDSVSWLASRGVPTKATTC